MGGGVVIIANDWKSCDFKFVAFTDTCRVWSGRYLSFPKSEPDLTVDLSNCVIDVSSRCDLSLTARDTVEPADELTDKFQLDLSLVARDTVEPALHVCMI